MRFTLLFVFALFISSGVFAQTNKSGKSVSHIQPYELRVFPNPTTDSFQIVENNLVDKIVVFNIIGREVQSFTHEPNKKYSLAEFPDGMYFLSLVSETDGVLKTLRISKRIMRP